MNSMIENRMTPLAGPDEDGPYEDRIELIGLLLVIAREKRMILRATLAAAFLGSVIAMLLPGVYSARAVILPPQEDHSGLNPVTLGALSALSSAAGSGGLGSAIGLDNPGDIYIGMLKSRSVADALIQRFDLQALYDTGSLAETREELAKQVSVTNGTDGLISVVFEDGDAQRAADIANAYVGELESLTRRIAITEAAQRRLFIEQQLKLTQDKLAQAENALQHTQEQTGVIDLDNQGRAIIEAVAELRAQAATKEIQISTMQTYATPRNPDLIRARRELTGLKAQIEKFEHDNISGNGDIMVATGRMPEAGLEYLRKLRDMKYQQAVYEMLAKQYESARVDEARNSVVIQVVDPAVVLDEETGPRRTLIVLVSTVFALLLAVMWALARAGMLHVHQSLGQNMQWIELREHLRWRS
jgi:uncharacterized protein involved in exopolysaccharide biosynthesis